MIMMPTRLVGGRIIVGFIRRRSSNPAQRRNSSSPSASASPPPPPPPHEPSRPFFSGLLNNPLRWYISKLDTHPMTTKCVSSGMISGSGDLLCQYLNPRDDPSAPPPSEGRATEDAGGGAVNEGRRRRGDETEEGRPATNAGFDWTRTARFVVLGSCLVAPTVHAWYAHLMKSIPGTGVYSVVRRLAWDQGLFAPLFLPAFLSCLTILEQVIPDPDEGDTPRNDRSEGLNSRLWTRLRNDVPEALVVGWSMWIPSMAFMFAFVPGKFQVLYSNGVGFVWNSYLSWKTHEGER
jgi:hypothetical protein